MTFRFRLLSIGLLAAGLCAAPSAAPAQVRPVVGAVPAPANRLLTVPQRGVPGGAVPQSAALGAPKLRGPAKNAIYGTLVQFTGNVLTIQTRNGRLRTVDATPAFAAGTISLPLFIGKLVAAEGLSRTDGVLSAARVSRVTRLDHLEPDR